MAFGQTDTDTLYDRSIAPVLRQRGIAAFRVDRSVRNEDIDDQILAGLQRCDLVIADLTYARPSVYFEAGVAHGRQVPVIFTCRTDHFKHRPDDAHGNLRVHFDLQMKPIIAWSAPGDARFVTRLARRIDHVTRPLLKHKEATALDQQRTTAFAPLPLRDKLNLLESAYRTSYRRLGYKPSKGHEGVSVLPARSNHMQWCTAHFANTLSRNHLINYGWSSYSHGLKSILKESFEAGRLPRRVTKTIILCSLQRVPASRVAAAFPASSIHTDNGLVLAKHQEQIEIEKYPKSRGGQVSWSHRKTAAVPTDVTIAVISGLKHEHELEAALKKVLA